MNWGVFSAQRFSKGLSIISLWVRIHLLTFQMNEVYHDEVMFNSHPMSGQFNNYNQQNNAAMMRPNSIELKRAYEQQQQRQPDMILQPPHLQQQQQLPHQFGNGHLNNYNNNESIYTPRVLLASNQDQPPSPRYYPSSNLTNGQMFQHPDAAFGDAARPVFDVTAALGEQLDILNFQREESPMGSGGGNEEKSQLLFLSRFISDD